MPCAVLIVEDAGPCRSTLAIALSSFPGVEVWTAVNGREAVGLLQGSAAGCVCALVTDLHMPLLDGFALIEAVRANPAQRSMPILVLSGCTDPATPARAFALGADAYFVKPYSPGQVRAKLRQLLYERTDLLAKQ